MFLASTAAGLTATAVPGGFRLTGRGPFASGVNHCQWLYLGAPVPAEDGPPEHRFFLVRRDQVTVQDVWHTSAMRGTGSNIVVVDDVFVPESFSVRHADLREGVGAGATLYDHYLYRLPWVATVPLIYTSTMLGAARASYDAVVAALRTKRMPNGARVAASEELQIQVSYAAAKIASAGALLREIADRADSGRPYTLEERAGVTSRASYAASVLAEAADDLLSLAGTSGFADDSLVHQAWRDVHFGAAHQSLTKRMAAARFRLLELRADDVAKPIFY